MGRGGRETGPGLKISRKSGKHVFAILHTAERFAVALLSMQDLFKDHRL